MTTPWSTLPNARHIDAILVHLKANPERWSAARDVAWSAARDAAWDAAWDAARDVAWSAAWDVAWDAARDVARDAARDAAWGALLALIAYDDCVHILSLPSGAVRLMCSVGDQKAVLLYPAVLAMEGV